jgi:arginyl-tRNA synthetase
VTPSSQQADPLSPAATAGIKSRLQQALLATLTRAKADLNNLPLEPAVLEALRLERPRQREHGDYAVNVSSLARYTKMAPPKIAEVLVQHWQESLASVHAIGGFLNFRLSQDLLAQQLTQLLHTPALGLNQALADQRVLLEYVSANPTGPLHIGHGRWAALGDAIRRVLTHCGATVTPEFYINDAGVQMGNITQSVWRRCLELLDSAKYPFPQKQGDEPYPYYPGEYVIDVATAWLEEPGNRDRLTAAVATNGETLPEELAQAIRTFTKDRLLGEQQMLLERFSVPFDVWYSEQTLHAAGRVQQTIEQLKASGYTFEEEGALWFRSTAFGDEKDRVLVKSDGSFTYLTADIAYHADKFSRTVPGQNKPYNKIINIWGADHHGYIARMRAAVEAIGYDPNQFEVLLGQLVNLIVDGEKTRMGKRRSMLTLADVIDEVGVDATRFWMVSKSADTALDFDVQLASSKTEDNPVFYVQYAHARCCSILRNAVQEHVNVQTGQTVAPPLSPAELEEAEKQLTPASLALLFEGLQDDTKAKEALTQLIIRLDGFEDLVIDSARLRAPHLIARYCLDLAADFHSFYNVCRILTPDKALTTSRLMLIIALRRVLAQGLALLGVSAPESM